MGKLFPTESLADRVEFLMIRTEEGHETTIVQRDCDFAYYVLSGAGHFVIDGHEEPCTGGDLVVIPHGRVFTYRGRLQMLLVVTPPWRAAQEVTL